MTVSGLLFSLLHFFFLETKHLFSYSSCWAGYLFFRLVSVMLAAHNTHPFTEDSMHQQDKWHACRAALSPRCDVTVKMLLAQELFTFFFPSFCSQKKGGGEEKHIYIYIYIRVFSRYVWRCEWQGESSWQSCVFACASKVYTWASLNGKTTFCENEKKNKNRTRSGLARLTRKAPKHTSGRKLLLQQLQLRLGTLNPFRILAFDTGNSNNNTTHTHTQRKRMLL